MWVFTSRPSAVSSATSARRTSPEEMWGTPSSSARRTPCVPLPPPGGASMRTLTPPSLPRVLAVAAAGPAGPEAVLRTLGTAAFDVPDGLRTRGFGAPDRLRLDGRRRRAPLPAVEQDEDDAARDGGEDDRGGHGHGSIPG